MAMRTLDIILVPFFFLPVLQVPVFHEAADEMFVDKILNYDDDKE